jgi:hypothetical protein
LNWRELLSSICDAFGIAIGTAASGKLCFVFVTYIKKSLWIGWKVSSATSDITLLNAINSKTIYSARKQISYYYINS